MPAVNRHLPVVETRRLPQTYGLVWQRTSFSNRKPSAGDRRLTSFYRTSTVRETQCWQWSPKLQGQSTMPKSYVYCLPEIDFPRGRIHASIPLSRDDRQPSFTAHRLQRRKKLNADGGLPLEIHYTVFCRFVKQIGNKSPARGKRRALRFSCP